jgi:hypothetical protein
MYVRREGACTKLLGQSVTCMRRAASWCGVPRLPRTVLMQTIGNNNDLLLVSVISRRTVIPQRFTKAHNACCSPKPLLVPGLSTSLTTRCPNFEKRGRLHQPPPLLHTASGSIIRSSSTSVCEFLLRTLHYYYTTTHLPECNFLLIDAPRGYGRCPSVSSCT